MNSKAFIERDGRLVIENARLIYSNFRGEQTLYNHAGDRNVCVIIEDPEFAEHLIADGWNVKTNKTGEMSYIKVKISYKFREPSVFLHNRSTGVTALHEDTIGVLDEIDILSADIVMRPSRWSVNGNTGISAYLDTLHVIQQEDYFADKYKTFAGQESEE